MPEVTAEVVETARSRSIAVEYATQNTNQQLEDIINRLIQIQNTQNDETNRLNEVQNAQDELQDAQEDIWDTLDDIIETQKTASAELANLRILTQNSHLRQPLPLQKKIPGSGRGLALQIMPNIVTIRNAFNTDVPVNHPAADVGSFPPNFNRVLSGYAHIDILMMVVHYNENFGIVVGDLLAVRVDKFRAFLCTQLLA